MHTYIRTGCSLKKYCTDDTWKCVRIAWECVYTGNACPSWFRTVACSDLHPLTSLIVVCGQPSYRQPLLSRVRMISAKPSIQQCPAELMNDTHGDRDTPYVRDHEGTTLLGGAWKGHPRVRESILLWATDPMRCLELKTNFKNVSAPKTILQHSFSSLPDFCRQSDKSKVLKAATFLLNHQLTPLMDAWHAGITSCGVDVTTSSAVSIMSDMSILSRRINESPSVIRVRQ